MPSAAKGARLYLREERCDRHGNVTHPATYYIRESGRSGRTISTGCGAGEVERAQDALRRHLGESALAGTKAQGNRAPAGIAVYDVIDLYERDVVPNHARPDETKARLARLLGWWKLRRLSDVTGRSCRAYANSRPPGAARRELEELRAAINHYTREGLLSEIVAVWMPEAGVSRERWCTRDEIARLIWAAWRYREVQKGKATQRHSRRHVARFILTALYTGTRAGAVCAASLGPTDGRGWIDLERGIFYRRPAGARESKKRRPPVPLPNRLLAHLRRWHRHGQRFAVEFEGEAVRDCDKAFRNVARDAGLPDVTPHVLRHTAATWLMQAGTDPWEAAGYLGMTLETLERVYGHHHPDHQARARAAFDRPHVVAEVVARSGEKSRKAGRSGRI